MVSLLFLCEGRNGGDGRRRNGGVRGRTAAREIGEVQGMAVVHSPDVRAMVLDVPGSRKSRVPALFAGFADANPAQVASTSAL